MKKTKMFIIYFAAIILAVAVIISAVHTLPSFVREMTTAVNTSNKVTESTKTTKKETAAETESSDNLILVNAKHKFKGKPDDLVSIFENKSSSYFVKDKNVLISKRVMKPLNKMMDAFQKETGLKTVNIISGYRTFDDQKRIYARIEKQSGSSYAKEFVQKPGYSEHHTGLAIDFAIFHSKDGSSEDFKGEGKYAWFYANSWKYGFVRRYDESKKKLTGIGYEPWHFRYVGKKNAEYMYKHNLCLEEYLSK